MVYFQISAKDTLIDEPLDIELHDLTPHTSLWVRAQFQDDLAQTWFSQAQFQSDAMGKIELSTALPQAGYYQQPDPMGLFWSMQVQTDKLENTIYRPATNSLTPLQVTLTAVANSKIFACATLTRRFLRADVNRIDLREKSLIATLFIPTYIFPKATILVFGGSGGGFSWSQQVASILASRGYATMAVAYFDWLGKFGLPKQFTELPLELFTEVYNYLAIQTDLNLNNLTVIGYSKGAELALLLATIYPEIKRVIAYVPSSIVWRGFTQRRAVPQSSWSYQGQSLPFALFANGHFDETGWQDQARIEAATIPVEKIAGPILLVSATNDGVWPSTRMANAIMHRMANKGCTQIRRHLPLAQAGHSLHVPNLPTVAYKDVGRVINAQAERQAWSEMLGFLNLTAMPI